MAIFLYFQLISQLLNRQVILDPKTSRRVFELARDQQEELEELDDDDDEDDDSEEQPKFRQPRDDDDTSEDDMDQEGDEEEEYAEIVRSISLYL